MITQSRALLAATVALVLRVDWEVPVLMAAAVAVVRTMELPVVMVPPVVAVARVAAVPVVMAGHPWELPFIILRPFL